MTGRVIINLPLTRVNVVKNIFSACTQGDFFRFLHHTATPISARRGTVNDCPTSAAPVAGVIFALSRLFSARRKAQKYGLRGRQNYPSDI